jgi:AraC-like DNA-binding protein
MRLLGATDLDVLEGLLEQHPGSPFFVKDAQLRYVAANRAMARLCGLGAGRDLIGRRAGELFGEELGRYYETLDRTVLDSGRKLTNFLEPTRARGGAQAWLLFTRVPVREPQGAVVGVAANAYRLPTGEAAERCYVRLREAVTLLRSDFAEPVSMRAVAARIGASVTQLERDFRKVLDTTPSAYLDALRLDYAKGLLADPALSVAEVAYACGYADQSAFSRRFLKEVGTTPTRYRKGRRMAAGPQTEPDRGGAANLCRDRHGA